MKKSNQPQKKAPVSEEKLIKILQATIKAQERLIQALEAERKFLGQMDTLKDLLDLQSWITTQSLKLKKNDEAQTSSAPGQ